MDIADRLRHFEVLSHLSDSLLDQLAGCLSRASFAAGTTVVKEGDRTEEAYLVDAGEIRVQRSTPYGLYPLASLGPGELFGESSFVDQEARSTDAVAIQDSVLLPLHPEALAGKFEHEPRFQLALYWAFWKSLSKKLRATNERLAQFFSKVGSEPLAAASKGAVAGEFHIGIHAKRELFREQKLSPLEINFLASLSREQRLQPNEVIFREGEDGDRMYVVLEGQVMISKQIVGAGEEALAFVERGDYFGEMALIDHQPRSADARAHDRGAVVLGISREVLEGILDIQKVSSLRLLRLLCGLVAKRLREVDDKLIGWYIFSSGSGESLEVPD